MLFHTRGQMIGVGLAALLATHCVDLTALHLLEGVSLSSCLQVWNEEPSML